MKIPPDILDRFEKATLGLDYGVVTLELHLKGGRARYVLTRQESQLIHDRITEGERNES